MSALRFALVCLGLLGACTATALFVGTDFSNPEIGRFVLLQLRLPRLLIGLLVGANLSLVGGAFQILFQNPLATPSTVGTTAGATLGALMAIVLGLDGWLGLSAVTLGAFIMALLASSLVLSTALSARARIEEVLLAGIAVTLATGAISQSLHMIADAPDLFAATQWSLGQLPQVGYDRVTLLLLPVVLSSWAILSQSRSLGVLSLGEDRARSLGVNGRRVRGMVLWGGCLGVGASVALTGPIAFVGLLVPHVVRRSIQSGTHRFLPSCLIAGATFLTLADTLARWLIPGRELPVGVLTASLGAPALFALVLQRQRS